jgi:hypothetical protein
MPDGMSTAASAVYDAITDLEGDMERLRAGTTAAAILVTYIREAPADDPRRAELLDLQEPATWIALAVEQLAGHAYEKWRVANALAYDAAYPGRTERLARSAVQS